jgi:hypothetical protein
VASARRVWKGAAVLGVVAAIALIAIPAALAAFGAKTQNEGDIVTAAADFTPPAITAAAIGKTVGGATGFIKQGGTYYVYATVATDTGHPASGIASVTANVTTITTGQTAVALVAGTYTAGGVSYNYRSAALTAAAVLGEGTKAFTITATDKAGNAKTFSANVTVDNTPPKASDIQTANGGATVGRAEEKDSITYTFSEPIEPESILAGWNGSATNVVVRMVDNGLLGLATGNDELIVNNAANSAALPLGTVNMGSGEYVTSLLGGALGGSIYFGATGTASSMTMSGNTVTITLGTYSAESILVGRATAGTAGSMIWTPVATPFDRAANPMSTTPVTQTGAAKKEF